MNEIRQRIIDRLMATEQTATFADGFDDAIVGLGQQFTKPPVVIYDYHKCIEILMDRDGMTLDEEQQLLALLNGEFHRLTGTEFRLLRYFMLNPDKPLSKTRLTEHLYDQEFDRDSNLIEVYVRRLREKIGRSHIETRRGQGYVFRD